MSTQLFIVSMVAGLMLVGAEIFVPGGILGVIGGIFLLIAVVTGFTAFGPTAGAFIAVGMVILLGIVMALWIKIFPRTAIGKRMAVNNDLSAARATEHDIEQLIGKEGETLSSLRPAGFALIEGRRVDVVTQGGMIDKGTRVRVVDIEGNGVVVAKAPQAESATEAEKEVA